MCAFLEYHSWHIQHLSIAAHTISKVICPAEPQLIQLPLLQPMFVVDDKSFADTLPASEVSPSKFVLPYWDTSC